MECLLFHYQNSSSSHSHTEAHFSLGHLLLLPDFNGAQHAMLQVFITWCISIGLGIVDALLVKTGSRLSNEYCLYPKSLVDFVHIIIVFILLSCLGLSVHLGMRIKKLRTSSLSEPSGSRKGSLPIKAREDINWNDYLLNEPKKPKSPNLQEQQVVLGNQPQVASVQLGTPSPTSQRLSGGLREGTVAPLRSTIPEDEPSGEVDDAEHTKTDNSLPYTKKAQSVKKGKVAPLKGDLEIPLSSAASMEGVDKKKIRSIFPVRFRVGQSSDEGTIQGIPRGRWPTRPEQSLLPTILRWLTSSGQREVYGVLEITLLILVQMIFVMPQSLNAVFFSVGIDQDPRIHFYLQWLVFGPVIITACLYAPTTLCDSCCSHEEPGNKPEKSISSI